MENVNFKKDGNLLTITVDLSKSGSPSASGKTIVIASSKGNVLIDPDKKIYLGLNVYKAR